MVIQNFCVMGGVVRPLWRHINCARRVFVLPRQNQLTFLVIDIAEAMTTTPVVRCGISAGVVSIAKSVSPT